MTDRIPILRVENLTVGYRRKDSWLEAVRNVSLTVQVGQSYGLVGESGSGKTTLALAIMGYLTKNGAILSGQILFEGSRLIGLDEAERRKQWGTKIGFVPQDPQPSLNPAIRVGEQLVETLRFHLGLDKQTATVETLDWLRRVGIHEPERVSRSFPHQISGGMQQRVLIAIALCLSPQLLVLDEPTTNLDVTTQAAILDLIQGLIQERQTSVLYVTHNLGVVAQICDRVAVLYAGELVEDAPQPEIFAQPRHPYTIGLLDSLPRPGEIKGKLALRSIPGSIPPINSRPQGCVFASRCSFAVEICAERPPLYQVDQNHQTRCHRWQEIAPYQLVDLHPIVQAPGDDSTSNQSTNTLPAPFHARPLLEARDVSVKFQLSRSLEDVFSGAPTRQIAAVENVSLTVEGARTIGLVGESGSGKTTLARTIAGLIERSGGEIELFQIPLPARLEQRDLDTLRHIQMVFQSPDESLNPYMSIGESLRRPFITLLGKGRAEADREVRRILAMVHLPVEVFDRRPEQLSGGEKQRIAIARAFAVNPDLLIADEPVSSLDVSVQAAILNLLNELQRKFGTAILFISHDLSVVSYLADEILVFYLGQIMQRSPSGSLFEPPYHPYTEVLLSAIPTFVKVANPKRNLLTDEIPGAANRPAGCPFHTRCPRSLGDLCAHTPPPWQTSDRGDRIYCHIPLAELAANQSPLTSPTNRTLK